MGRGLSTQQKAILIHVYQEGGKVEVGGLPAFGHDRPEYKSGSSLYGTAKYVKTDVERASVARSITRLNDRGLLERGRWSVITLTPAGLQLAEELLANG